MSRSKSAAGGYHDPHQDLFERIEDRKRRHLFLPSILDKEARALRLRQPEREAAYEVIKAWWEQAEAGRLNRKETTVDDQFLAQVFGQALGYRGVTDTTERYERERQFHVPSIGACDAALGDFPKASIENVRAVIELKGAHTHLDRDKSGGRTPVQQLWDYLNAMPPTCKWGILSNFTTIRLYHRAKGSQVYQQYKLSRLVEDRNEFDQFYSIFEPYGLIRKRVKEAPLAERLLDITEEKQRTVGDDLYKYYSENRLRLIHHLHRDKGMELETSIRVAQKLIDRVLFIAFCEDRRLITADAIKKACEGVSYFSRARNPVWQNFLGLFHQMDKGSPQLEIENGYNGGLFREDELIDSLDLDDQPWTNFFQGLGKYDYEHEVNVDVLGHLFEKSITELEKLREGALYGDRDTVEAPMMPKSPQRKLFGVYYTPVEFTTAIVDYTIDEVVAERFRAVQQRHQLSDEDFRTEKKKDKRRAYWQDCLETLKSITVCDPACGSGAFLIQAYEKLFHHYAIVITELEHLGEKNVDGLFDAVPDTILKRNLYGVDLQPEAVEIAQLSLWLRTARVGKTLADLAENIVCGNSLTDDPAVHPRALKWDEAFPSIFDGKRKGFDCVIGNPPWERLKLQEREFFALSAPKIASAVSAAKRRKLIEALKTSNPDLYATYERALAETDRVMADVRSSDRYPLTGKGDINTYSLFAELATNIVAPDGRVGLLVPSGIATDKTTAAFFRSLMDSRRLQRLYDFENKAGIFPDVHRAFKFSILNFAGSATKFDAADFVFFAHSLNELRESKRHIPLTAEDMKRLNPNTRTCPIFRDRRSADITKVIYGRVPVLIDHNRKSGGNPWSVSFLRMFDQTNDAEHFVEPKALKAKKYRLDGNRWVKGKKQYLPLYEAKMIQAYDHRAASVEIVESNWMRQGQTAEPTLVEYQNPEHVAMPRWWVDAENVEKAIRGRHPALLAYKDVTSPTNSRTMIASFIPFAGVVNSAPLVFAPDHDLRRQCCLLANLNSMAYDFVARQKVGGVHLNYFIVEQLPTFAPDVYDDPCPWEKRKTLESWIAERVLKLSCTANDMIPLAEACGMKPPVHKWKPADREMLLAELDAAYFILYGLSREDVIYILTTFAGTRKSDSTLFEPDPKAVLSESGQRIVQVFDELSALG